MSLLFSFVKREMSFAASFAGKKFKKDSLIFLSMIKLFLSSDEHSITTTNSPLRTILPAFNL